MIVTVPARSRAAYSRRVFPSSGFLSLGALTAEQAAQSIFPNAPRSSSAGHNMATFDAISAAAGSGQMSPTYMDASTGCAGVKLGTGATIAKAATAAGGLVLKMGVASGNPIVIGAGAAAELAGTIFGAIFGHHAAAVAKERSILCAAVPAANQAIVAIDQAVQEGNFTPQNGIDALNATVAGFQQAVTSIQHGADPTSSGECNAACVMLSQLRAIVLRKVSVYQDMITAAVAAASSPSSASNPVTSIVQSITGGGSLLPWAAAGILAFLILKD